MHISAHGPLKKLNACVVCCRKRNVGECRSWLGQPARVPMCHGGGAEQYIFTVPLKENYIVTCLVMVGPLMAIVKSICAPQQ